MVTLHTMQTIILIALGTFVLGYLVGAYTEHIQKKSIIQFRVEQAEFAATMNHQNSHGIMVRNLGACEKALNDATHLLYKDKEEKRINRFLRMQDGEEAA